LKKIPGEFSAILLLQDFEIITTLGIPRPYKVTMAASIKN